MIRVRKSGKVPRSLVETATYDKDDVVRQLSEDQYEKCYICERHLTADFEIDHLCGRSSEHPQSAVSEYRGRNCAGDGLF